MSELDYTNSEDDANCPSMQPNQTWLRRNSESVVTIDTPTGTYRVTVAEVDGEIDGEVESEVDGEVEE